MYDLAIIGGGPGGYVAAIRGAQNGLKVLLIEKDSLGGTCLNRGCIPTKCFIHDVKLLEEAKRSPVIKGTEALSIDLDKMVARKRKTVKTLVGGLGSLMKANGIDVEQGQGELIAPGRIRIQSHQGTDREHEARQVILATGSKPAVPSFIEADGRFVQTTDEALDPEDIPEKLTIIGGGVIGLEMATIYRNLGSEVTILELLTDIITNEEIEIRRAMRMLMEKRGVKIHLKTKVQEVVRRKGKVQVVYEGNDGLTERIQSDRVLMATGRVPVLDGINANKLGLGLNGIFVKVNARLETNLPGVYAIGDLNGGLMLAHKASAEAEAVIVNILGGCKEIRPELIPRCIWGFTEIGSVGLTEEEAKKTGRSIKVGKFLYLNSPAAQAREDVDGMVKIIGDAETGEILGVHIIGPRATDLIGEPVMAMTMESVVEDLSEVIKPHPTLSETIVEAAMDWNGRAIHRPGKR
ncbi:MAG: dihydrolipoyl dehydrogenase [Deltaproteobacteria bacterium]|nr:dihydrolipoyl dehydrogenase [Deltaproteobacteria bacterium]